MNFLQIVVYTININICSSRGFWLLKWFLALEIKNLHCQCYLFPHTVSIEVFTCWSPCGFTRFTACADWGGMCPVIPFDSLTFMWAGDGPLLMWMTVPGGGVATLWWAGSGTACLPDPGGPGLDLETEVIKTDPGPWVGAPDPSWADLYCWKMVSCDKPPFWSVWAR